ncbi:Tim44/TimA family putative adaptor protein [Paenirhodobacter enshiensis]|uniref:Preprotein translocase subunit Tim44 n=1 Tax=Paenirhodobacter enshiensis TaxID=1105367 RepID=A0A086Y3K5_9RHOB|nr:Tim44/TimA family putative adaptor protein [Paenirhodobacter enshiensis]KFI28855.1 preprotein translocase subunit Tim44 [Paenirhodobacter enshiensis]
MSDAVIKLVVLAAVAIFLILRLRSVLGTRDGFEKPVAPPEVPRPVERQAFEVVENGPDTDITDHVAEDSDAAKALTAMKLVEPSFSVSEFLKGARQAYEMILMAFETGEIDKVRSFLSPEVAGAFDAAVAERKAKGLDIHADFMGLTELTLSAASFDRGSNLAEITIRFGAELISAAKDASGTVVEGDPKMPRKQRDVWTFSRTMGSADPNWVLAATGG